MRRADGALDAAVWSTAAGVIVVMTGIVLAAIPAGAQPGVLARARASVREDTREQHMQVLRMERVFEDAVSRGVRTVERQLPGPTPAFALFAGPIRARGFVLEGYGVFFDVEFPVLRRSLLWSMRVLDPLGPSDAGFTAVLQDLRRRLANMQDARSRAIVEETSGDAAAGVDDVGGFGGPDAADRSLPAGAQPVVDLGKTYIDALTAELSTAIVAVGQTLDLDGESWLTVAARDGRGGIEARLAQARETLQLRIRGRDLEAFREGRTSAEDVMQRVEVRRP